MRWLYLQKPPFTGILDALIAGAATTAQFLTEKTGGTSKDCLRKLFMDRKNIYLYPGYEDTKDSLPKVYIVPLSEVASIEIIKNRGLCQD